MCLFPLSIKVQDSYGVFTNHSVPCGKCIECLKDRQNSWKIRLTEEARDHLYVYFFTLTYNDHSVPFSYDERTGERVNHVRKSDVQLWTKRHRIAYERLFKRDIDFKYFICSEYGPNTGRPHYHGILFTDISPVFICSMFNDWRANYGFTNFSEVGKSGKKKTRSKMSSVGNYVAKYCIKPRQLRTKAELRIDELIEAGVIPAPWHIMSKGLGKSYIERMKRYHVPHIRDPKNRISIVVDRAWYHDGVFKYKLPRYFRDRLFRKQFPCEQKIWNKKNKCYETKIVKRFKSQNFLALQMQVEVRNRVLEEYNRRVQDIRSVQNLSYTEAACQLERSERIAREARLKDIYSKMSRFYHFNRSKNKQF